MLWEWSKKEQKISVSSFLMCLIMQAIIFITVKRQEILKMLIMIRHPKRKILKICRLFRIPGA